jgi:imidazolonepropionase-like amidohydrolase
VANSASEVRQRVRELLNGGADFIKIMATGAVLTGHAPRRARVQRGGDAGGRGGGGQVRAKVTAHAHGAEGIKNAIRAGVQSIEHGSLMDDEAISMMKEHGTYLVADIYNGDYIATEGKRLGWPAEYLRKNDETTEAQRQGFRKAVPPECASRYGTDSGVYPMATTPSSFPTWCATA